MSYTAFIKKECSYDLFDGSCLQNIPMRGIYTVPGCKSISHRALILPAACKKSVVIHNLNTGEDVTATKNAITLLQSALGITIGTSLDHSIYIMPANHENITKDPLSLNLANAGTGARLIMGLVASIPGLITKITGDESLKKRPMERVSKPLSLMGAKIQLTEKKTLPATVQGTQLNGIQYTIPMPSAQIKSALLIAGLRASGQTIVKEPALSRDHTEHMLSLLGVNIQIDHLKTTLTPNYPHHSTNPIVLHIPGDASAAAFWCVAGTLISGSHIQLNNINGNPQRIEFLNVLKNMGAPITYDTIGMACGEPLINISIKATSLLNPIITNSELSASLMDEYPILAVAAAFADGVSVFNGIKELSVKESNRIQKIKELLNCFGIHVAITDDLIVIKGNPNLLDSEHQASLPSDIYYDTAYDHRMAMCAVILGRILKKKIYYSNPDCIATSFPNFMDQITSKINKDGHCIIND